MCFNRHYNTVLAVGFFLFFIFCNLIWWEPGYRHEILRLLFIYEVNKFQVKAVIYSVVFHIQVIIV